MKFKIILLLVMLLSISLLLGCSRHLTGYDGDEGEEGLAPGIKVSLDIPAELLKAEENMDQLTVESQFDIKEVEVILSKTGDEEAIASKRVEYPLAEEIIFAEIPAGDEYVVRAELLGEIATAEGELRTLYQGEKEAIEFSADSIVEVEVAVELLLAESVEVVIEGNSDKVAQVVLEHPFLEEQKATKAYDGEKVIFAAGSDGLKLIPARWDLKVMSEEKELRQEEILLLPTQKHQVTLALNETEAGFEAEEGFLFIGTFADGEDILLISEQEQFGTKLTQHPYVVDRVDRGSWLNGEKRFPYGDITIDDLVPSGPEYVFSGKGNDVRFRTTDDELGPNREFAYGGNLAEDGTSEGAPWDNLTMRRPNPEQELPETVDQPRPNYFASWLWRSTFDPGDGDNRDNIGVSAKFVRVWGLKDGSSFGRFRNSWTRMHMTLGEIKEREPYPSWPNTNIEPDTWALFEYDVRMKEEGFVRGFVNGEKLHDININAIGEGEDGPWNGAIWMRQWGYDPSKTIEDPAYEIDFTDFYSDASPARVVITDSNVWEESTYRVPQVHTSWEQQEIKMRDLYAGPLQSLSSRHLFVVREDREVLYLGQIE